MTSSRAGFLPIGLRHVPIDALRGIDVYLRLVGEGMDGVSYPLYCAESDRFHEDHRRRLLEHRVRFVYIRMADQSRFRTQTEEALENVVNGTEFATAEKAMIVYDTSVELINELLSEPELAKSPRLEEVSRSITSLVIDNPTSFAHLLAVSHHDFYTATHMVNVATMMVPLAYELGVSDPDELNRLCQAGLLHDIGKMEVAEEVLNKRGQLSEEDWEQIRRHPEAGCEYLERAGIRDPIMLAVTRQHHERLDGTGYPAGLKNEQIGMFSRVCAVVDSFDAMTAFRPFKEKTLSVADAMEILRVEKGKYDPEVVSGFVAILEQAEKVELMLSAPPAPTRVSLARGKPGNRRRHPRATFYCAGRAETTSPEGQRTIEITAHSVSRSGLGILSPEPIGLGEPVRVFLKASGWAGRALTTQVVRCNQHSDSWYEIGLEFVEVGSDGVREVLNAAA